uniref:Alternative protein ADAMTS16 n=1 Tax=Homo sapiens TaxID=9606 RepID=L8E9K8_HUMAN|nr:alternative protein ADAMTS16 [Homo sapiens]
MMQTHSASGSSERKPSSACWTLKRTSVKPCGAIVLEGNVRLNLCQQQKAQFVGMTCGAGEDSV